METNESNKLIVVFMGLKPLEISGRHSISKNHCVCVENTAEKAIEGFSSIAKYHTSWDWLMEVVEKIYNLNYDVRIGTGGYCTVADLDPDRGNYEEDFCGASTLHATYTAVIEFIKWHNQQK